MSHEADNNKKEEDDEQYSSSSEESDDDPRVAAMFPQASAAAPSRQVHVDDHAILNCFQKSLQAFHHTDPASLGLWQAPPLFPKSTTSKDDNALLADWQPASLPLPSWVVQPPPSSS